MRRRTAAVAGMVALAGIGAGLWLVTRDDDTAATADTETTIATAEVTTRDLVIYDETDATLGFTTSVTVSAPVAGTVTGAIAAGDHVDPGTVVANIDGAPVVAMLGDVPAYRDLSTSASDGIDIRQLEANLVLLGFDPDGEVIIDEEYDAATADAWHQPLRDDQVLRRVGQHLEAIGHQRLRGFHQAQRIRLQVVVVADDLQLEQVGLQELPGQARHGERLEPVVDHDGLGNRQAESTAAAVERGSGQVEAVEPLEDPLELVRCDPGSLV